MIEYCNDMNEFLYNHNFHNAYDIDEFLYKYFDNSMGYTIHYTELSCYVNDTSNVNFTFNLPNNANGIYFISMIDYQVHMLFYIDIDKLSFKQKTNKLMKLKAFL